MISSVHGKKLVICGWTGETFESEKRFKIPKYKRSAGAVEWEGCYSSPGAALAAMTVRNKADNLTAEQHEECIQVFQASLRRTPEHTLDKFTIQSAPPYTELKRFGGEMSLEAFYKKYDHQKQVTFFNQDIKCRSFLDVDVEVDQDADGSGPEMTAAAAATEKEHRAAVAKFVTKDDEDRLSTNAPKKWFHTSFVPGSAPVPKDKTNVPRGTSGLISWIRELAKNTRHPNAVVLYLHPTHDNLFAVGLPEHWQEQGNKAAADSLAKTTVFGPVEMFHKFANRGVKRAASSKSEEPATDAEAASAEPLKKKIKRSNAVADLSSKEVKGVKKDEKPSKEDKEVKETKEAAAPAKPIDSDLKLSDQIVPETQLQKDEAPKKGCFPPIRRGPDDPEIAEVIGTKDPLDWFN